MSVAQIISLIFGFAGCIVGIAGWFSNHNKKITSDAEWKGSVNTKLDNIQNGVSGIDCRLSTIEHTVADHEKRLYVVEAVEKIDAKEHVAS